MIRAARWILLVALVMGCGNGGGPATSVTSTTADGTTTSSTSPPGPPCLQGDQPFTSDPGVIAYGEGGGDAAALAAVRWQSHSGCERIVLDFLTADGAPATSIGAGDVQLIPISGIVRIGLPGGVGSSAIADLALEGDLAGRVFVVRRDQGAVAVDVHLATADEVQVRGFALDAPARVVVDLAPGTRPDVVLTPAAVADNVVVLTPAPGPNEYPIRVSGYARTFEANVVVRVYGGGELGSEATTTAADWTEMWGEFAVEIAAGPDGTAELFVGEDAASDGAERGLRITLDLQ